MKKTHVRYKTLRILCVSAILLSILPMSVFAKDTTQNAAITLQVDTLKTDASIKDAISTVFSATTKSMSDDDANKVLSNANALVLLIKSSDATSSLAEYAVTIGLNNIEKNSSIVILPAVYHAYDIVPAGAAKDGFLTRLNKIKKNLQSEQYDYTEKSPETILQSNTAVSEYVPSKPSQYTINSQTAATNTPHEANKTTNKKSVEISYEMEGGIGYKIEREQNGNLISKTKASPDELQFCQIYSSKTGYPIYGYNNNIDPSQFSDSASKETPVKTIQIQISGKNKYIDTGIQANQNTMISVEYQKKIYELAISQENGKYIEDSTKLALLINNEFLIKKDMKPESFIDFSNDFGQIGNLSILLK